MVSWRLILLKNLLRRSRSGLLPMSVLIAGLLVTTARAELLSAADRQAYHLAFAAERSGNWAAASREADSAKDPLLRKVLYWMNLLHGDAGTQFSAIVDFLQHNPDWPGQTALRERAERELVGIPDNVLMDWFGAYPPITPAGRLKQADLMLQAGQREAATAQIRDVWIDGDFSAIEERSILDRYFAFLRTEDHIKRLDRLVWNGFGDAAQRMMPRVPLDWQLLAEARLKLQDLRPGLDKVVARVPARLQNDPALLYEKVRWWRRKELYPQAIDGLVNAPRDAGHPSAWWVERQILTRRALGQGNTRLAYRLASQNGLVEGPAVADAEFLAGWIALRFLHDPKPAYEHFVRLYDLAKGSTTEARGAYWAGRAAEALNFPELAGAWFTTAAEDPAAYYGQLAFAKLGGDSARLKPRPDPVPGAETVVRFQNSEIVRVIGMLAEIGETDRAVSFLHALGEKAKTGEDYVMVVSLAEALGHSNLAVAVAKKAGRAGFPLTGHGYPIIFLPASGTPEEPLVLAITRQESAFERAAISRVGARGLMQLMPATARIIAKAQNLPLSIERLTSDSRYNLTLGSAFLQSLIDQFSGSYVLSIAAYNAGPARVQQWIQEFGDPRGGAVDAIDWVELIPFNETRNYVQRVLENLQVYRMLLGDHRLVFSLAADLNR
jgi:soluble lytic murein transglycosylase